MFGFQFSIFKIAFAVLAMVSLFSLPAKATVPVHCPDNPCRTWDVALSGKLFGVPEAWFFRKEFGSVGDEQTGSLDSQSWKQSLDVLIPFKENILAWIQNPQTVYTTDFTPWGTEGSLFVTNIEKFILGASDNAQNSFIVEYLQGLDEELWCEPFAEDLAFELINTDAHGFGTFKENAACSVPEEIDLEAFYTDWDNGGWEAWLYTALPENNPLGMLVLANEEIKERQARAAEAAALDYLAGLGFYGLRECDHIEVDPSTGLEVCVQYRANSPGIAITRQLWDALSLEIGKLIAQDEMGEFVSGSFDLLNAWQAGGGSTGQGILGGVLDQSDDDNGGQPSCGLFNQVCCTTGDACITETLTCVQGFCIPANIAN